MKRNISAPALATHLFHNDLDHSVDLEKTLEYCRKTIFHYNQKKKRNTGVGNSLSFFTRKSKDRLKSVKSGLPLARAASTIDLSRNTTQSSSLK